MASAMQLAQIQELDMEKRSRASRQFVNAQRQNIAGQDEEATLVLAAKSGDGQAFEILMERYQRRILAVARRFTRTREDAEDIIQQSFQKAFVHLHEFEGKSSFSTWLTRIAINEALMYLRKGRRGREVSIGDLSGNEETPLLPEMSDSHADPEGAFLQGERIRILSAAMNKLTPGIRTAIELRELGELSTQEAARVMGLSVAAVKGRVFQGRRKLHEVLKHQPAWMSGKQIFQASCGAIASRATNSSAVPVISAATQDAQRDSCEEVSGARKSDRDNSAARGIYYGMKLKNERNKTFHSPRDVIVHALHNQRVLVIGGSSGIGLAIAAATTDAGASVTIASRNQEKLTAAASKLNGAVHIAVLDTGDNGLLERFFERQMTWDHVVVSAAQTKVGSVRSLSLTDANAAMESKFWGAYRVARVARINDGGSLTLVSGFLSERPSATAVLQGAINAALEALARGLALELAPVRVNAVSPGMIETPIWDDLPSEKRRRMFEATAAQLPVRKIGQPEDIANAVLFLMTTTYATGSTVRVDGGGVIA